MIDRGFILPITAVSARYFGFRLIAGILSGFYFCVYLKWLLFFLLHRDDILFGRFIFIYYINEKKPQKNMVLIVQRISLHQASCRLL